MTTTATTALTITTIDNEARVLDTDLAVELGMARPNMIRTNLIVPNREELEGFGSLLETQAKPGPAGGRPSKAYYLNEEQALLLCMFARTERAKEVRAEAIRVFAAWRRGQLVPVAPAVAAPSSMKEALQLALRQCEQIERLAKEVGAEVMGG